MASHMWVDRGREVVRGIAHNGALLLNMLCC